MLTTVVHTKERAIAQSSASLPRATTRSWAKCVKCCQSIGTISTMPEIIEVIQYLRDESDLLQVSFHL